MRISGLMLAVASSCMFVSQARSQEVEACARLADLSIADTNLLSATAITPGRNEDLPPYCRVQGFVRPAINFEIRLPLEAWNGKFYMAGCGGFCGTVDADATGFTNAMNFGLRRSYAVSTMDSGHWGTGATDGRWAEHDTLARTDWAERAVTETARVTKTVIDAFYGDPPERSYFAGCSTGGRMAAMAALRHPDDFDGIVSGAPALDYTGLVATFFAWVAQANTGTDGGPIFPPAKLGLVRDAVLEACDAGDGVLDGLVSHPPSCRFDPEALACSGAEGPDCLSAAEVGVLEKWYGGAVDRDGRQLYPGGVPFGSEANWTAWLTGTEATPPVLPLFARDFLRYMAFDPSPAPDYEVADFDFERDPARLEAMADLYNAATFVPGDPPSIEDADLGPFRDRGGKLILYHGWGDPLVTPALTVDYYEALAKASGGMEEVRSFARLFMVPGMDHCGINTDGPGIADTGIDPLTALERWVEQDEPPSELIATKTAPDGATLWQRPVCAFPEIATYDGAGDPDEATSFTCTRR